MDDGILTQISTIIDHYGSKNVLYLSPSGLEDDSGDYEDYDCVVIGPGVLEQLKSPGDTFRAIPGDRLIVCMSNAVHIANIKRMLMGELPDLAGSFSQPSLFKLLLNYGWMPQLNGFYCSGLDSDTKTYAGLLDCARQLESSEEVAQRNLLMQGIIVECVRSPAYPEVASIPLSVIATVSHNEIQFDLNVAISPGLHEIGAQIIPCRGATSAADAFAKGRAEANGEWILLCHKDVYFPIGFGHAFSAIAETIPESEKTRTVIGFVGIGTNSLNEPFADNFDAGLVIDRINRFDWPEAQHVVSIDEFAVVLHRDTEIKIDQELGWHWWATDLCLQPNSLAKIVHVPSFHNSLSDHTLSGYIDQFRVSARKLKAKYPEITGIRSLCGKVEDFV